MGTKGLGIDDERTADPESAGDPPRPGPRPAPPGAATPGGDPDDAPGRPARPDNPLLTPPVPDGPGSLDGSGFGGSVAADADPAWSRIDAAWTLPADPRAAAHARAFTTGTLRAWARNGRIAADPAALDDIILIVDELITNAVVHGSGAVRLHLTLRGAPTAPVLHGEITDDDPVLPAVQSPTPSAPPVLDWSEDGRGLLLVTALATAYGTCPHPPGKTVWFTRTLNPRT
ncbi:ATP-binding protein [Actinomadura rupiterrae]|uniref:ATP-binding protein n=1 Tax=Actinomadura rupiterrae TaxID=559627 RepID=UPI0020A4CEDB|nr:ATP-binding protein [Actinomadura rupiterrae]MCP2343080.1 anti-sigma regulatory factor (Ser/Thr protein kinase) [Actinomadura rupiterrae]